VFLLLTSQPDSNPHCDKRICKREKHPFYALLNIRR
jgi:hypothetical protein